MSSADGLILRNDPNYVGTLGQVAASLDPVDAHVSSWHLGKRLGLQLFMERDTPGMCVRESSDKHHSWLHECRRRLSMVH
jgi:hypothetical protein